MQVLSGRRAAAESLVFSPDGRFVVAGGGMLRVWDLRRPDAEPTVLRINPPAGRVTFLSATVLAALHTGGWLRHDLTDGSAVPIISERSRVRPLGAVDPVRGVLKTTSWPAWSDPNPAIEVVTFRVTAQRHGEPVSANPTPGPQFSPVAFAPGGRYYGRRLGQPDADGLYDAATDARMVTFDRPRESRNVELHGASDLWRFAPDGGRAFTPAATRDGRRHILAYDCDKGGPPVAEATLPEGNYLRSMAAHLGGRILATVEDDRHVTFRDPDTLAVLKRYDFAMPKLTAVAFTPDGTRCAVGNSKGKVLLFDVDE